MTPQGQLTTSALQALVQDGTLTGSWTLDPARSQVLLESRHTWGLLPLHGVFRQVTGTGTVTGRPGHRHPHRGRRVGRHEEHDAR